MFYNIKFEKRFIYYYLINSFINILFNLKSGKTIKKQIMNYDKQQSNLNKKDLFRLPWSVNDNPIGWIEITDACNIRCKGCYRLLQKEGHKPFEEIKANILFMKKWRNIDVINIAGGEALLHPDIVKIVEFIKKQKLKSIILTNGEALNEEFLVKLRDAGLTGLSFHIDSTQQRPGFSDKNIKTEKELNGLRLKYAKMVKKVGFYSHFGITVTNNNKDSVPEFVAWALSNIKYVNGVSLSIFRGLPVCDSVEYYSGDQKVEIRQGTLGYAIKTEHLRDHFKTSAKEIFALLKNKYPNFEPSSYLGGTEDHRSFKWVIGNIIANTNGLTFGGYGKKTMEAFQYLHHFFRGTYVTYTKRRFGRLIFLFAFSDKCVRKALWKYIKYIFSNPKGLFYPVHALSVGMVQAADILADGSVDMCGDCPDMIEYNGKLVHSCRLDEHKQFGQLLNLKIKKEDALVEQD